MKLIERYTLLAVYTAVIVLLTVTLIDHFRVRFRLGLLKRSLTAREFHTDPSAKTGNPLIDDYGQNDPSVEGEMGIGVTLGSDRELAVNASLEKYHINTLVSDGIPLNRMVPDSRFSECQSIQYDRDLPNVSVVIPFHNEWPSVLYRTLYSIVNRTPRHLLHEIILVDDDSNMNELKEGLNMYIDTHFPEGLVKIVRIPERAGLIKARQIGWRFATGDAMVIFDSHMEVNTDWLQPLLTEIKRDRRTFAQSVLDYIKPNNFEYMFVENYIPRYGFDWNLLFFETFFRKNTHSSSITDARQGAIMVGSAFAVDRKYFGEIGGYDEKMQVWGGENLELSWRMWLCGGRLVHLPCSKVGHLARVQPYTFPGGRKKLSLFNYKRAVDVWMDPQYRKFVYGRHKDMEKTDVGDLSDRLALKRKLGCKTFSWFLDNVWPELNVYDRDARAWGFIHNTGSQHCLDNHRYLFQPAQPLFAEVCIHDLTVQGFTWTTDRLLKATLQCVVVKELKIGARPMLQDCIEGPNDRWEHVSGFLRHVESGLCITLDPVGPIMNICFPGNPAQQWAFTNYVM